MIHVSPFVYSSNTGVLIANTEVGCASVLTFSRLHLVDCSRAVTAKWEQVRYGRSEHGGASGLRLAFRKYSCGSLLRTPLLGESHLRTGIDARICARRCEERTTTCGGSEDRYFSSTAFRPRF